MPQLSMHSPLAPLTVSVEDEKIVALDWGWGRDQEETPVLLQARAWLEAYFDGDPAPCTLPLDPYGTPEQVKAWRFMLTIPAGQHVYWKDAARLADVTPETIVSACGENPIPILIPCHRIDLDDCPDYDPETYPGEEGAQDRQFLRNLETLCVTPRS
ncbi:O6-methylguanine-DNA methyltransferase [Komagataeibacter rhaeticus DSM 16663]|nr:MGMT family protein [Komagataeibacter rhaeticus]KDU96225.1 cysteine methyltransferase [Komagataeibacter rhaeticus AF1]WPP20973.1 MGMT family protein [Komagataeibacter rhaeticus]GBQ14002.1 O6-methylguanine-DNA methyltransferase [Komagataeibacter rhaeticus DSM 16663]